MSLWIHTVAMVMMGFVKDGRIINDDTLEILGKMAVAQAEAGADIIGAKRHDGWQSGIYSSGSRRI